MKNECNICLKPEGKILKFSCYSPFDERYHKKNVCEKCINKLVTQYFMG